MLWETTEAMWIGCPKNFTLKSIDTLNKSKQKNSMTLSYNMNTIQIFKIYTTYLEMTISGADKIFMWETILQKVHPLQKLLISTLVWQLPLYSCLKFGFTLCTFFENNFNNALLNGQRIDIHYSNLFLYQPFLSEGLALVWMKPLTRI